MEKVSALKHWRSRRSTFDQLPLKEKEDKISMHRNTDCRGPFARQEAQVLDLADFIHLNIAAPGKSNN